MRMDSSSYGRGTDYELFVKSVYDRLHAAQGVKTVNIQHNVRLKGSKGEHQIDLYWEFTIAGIVYRVAVECKNYKNPVSVDKIRAFHDTLEDIGGIKGVFVTTVGFQSGALEYAKSCGISPFIIHQPTEKDWAGRIMQVNLKIQVLSLANKKLSMGINYAEAQRLGINDKISKEIDTSAIIKYDSMLVKLNNEEVLGGSEEQESKTLSDCSQVVSIKSPDPLVSIYSPSQESLLDILKRCPTRNVGHVDVAIGFENGFIHFASDEISFDVTDIPVKEMHFSYDVIANEINTVIKADKDVLAVIYDVMNDESTIVPHSGGVVTTIGNGGQV